MAVPTHTDWLKIEAVLDRFEDAWQGKGEPRIQDYLADSEQRSALLVELVRIDLEYRGARGEPRRLEDYVGDFPEIADFMADLKAVDPRAPKASESQMARSTILLKPAGDPGKRSGADTPGKVGGANVDLPRFLGPYEVRRKLGGGGFSTVYHAWDPELKREVAIKVPHPGLFDDPEGATRLLREASSAARLRHPAIVPLHQVVSDGPATFLVYQFIPGPNLREVLKQTQPAPRQAAEWAARLAEALAYAHDSGIVHRDVKPANILMDADGQPMLADFGLAMQTDASVKLTRLGDVLGTPAYMSPEQAGGGSHAVDARTDIYSLGVVLYEMLCAKLPFTGSSTAVIEQVLHKEPTVPRQLNPRIPLDLETICLKAMSKEPARRYKDAGELGADLRRYLRDEPIQARPIRTPERLWRWARRNPRVAVLLFILFAVLVTGLTAVTFFWRLADTRLEATDTANQQLKKQIEATDIANEQLKKQKEAADTSSLQARKAVKDLFILATEHPTYQADGMQPARKVLLDSAMAYYRQFVAARRDDVSLREEIADAHDRMAQILNQIGTRAETAAEYRKACALYDELLREKPGDENLKVERAYAVAHVAGLEPSKTTIEEAIQVMAEAAEIRQRRVDANPEDLEQQRRLGRDWRKLGELQHAAHQNEAALTSLRKARDLLKSTLQEWPTDVGFGDLSNCCYLIGHVQRILDKMPEAAEAFKEAIVVQEKLLASHPDNTHQRIELARIHGSLNLVLGRMGHTEEASASVKKAIELREKSVQANPGINRFRHDLAISYVNLGVDLAENDPSPESSREVFDKALKLFDGLVQSEPTVAVYQLGLGMVHLNLHYYHRGKRDKQAADHLDQVRRAWEKAAELEPAHPEYRHRLGQHHVTVANTHRKAGRFKEARATYDLARHIFQELDRTDAGKPTYKHYLAEVLLHEGNIALQTGDSERGLKTQLDALSLRRELAERYPKVPIYQKLAKEYSEEIEKGARLLGTGVIVKSALWPFEGTFDEVARMESILGKLAEAHPELPVFQAELERLRNFGIAARPK